MALVHHLKLPLLAAVVITFIGMSGCAAGKPEKTPLAVHEMLAAAGFTYKVADGPDQRARFDRMPQQKLLRHVRKDRTVYYYADVNNCGCVFVGDEAAVSRYDRMRRNAERNQKRRQALEGQEAGVFYRGENPAAVIEDIDEGLAPGF